jgi:hypothetical protein
VPLPALRCSSAARINRHRRIRLSRSRFRLWLGAGPPATRRSVLSIGRA